MNSPVDRLASRLMQEVVDVAPAPPTWSDVLARVTTEPSTVRPGSRRRPWLAVTMAGGVSIATLVGLVVHERSRSGPGEAGSGQTAATPALSTSGPPVVTTADGASRPLSGSGYASCAYSYSPDTLAQRGFAFDGVVTSIETIDGASIPTGLVNFEVREWFAGGTAPEVTVMLHPQATDVSPPEFEVGSRLLISGGDAGGASGQPLPAWMCGFSRTYDPPTAALWRDVFAGAVHTDSTSTTRAQEGETVAPSDVGGVLFAPTSLPHGFRAVEARTWNGLYPGEVPRVSVETWVSRGADGTISDVVRLTAGRLPESPNLSPPAPTGLTVHGQRAELLTPPSGVPANDISWREQGLWLGVTSWGQDVAAIAERTLVSSANGVTLPDGVLDDSFVRLDTQVDPSLIGRLSSSLSLTGDDGRQIVLTVAPNVDGETAESLGSTRHARRRTVGRRDVWVSGDDGGHSSARWIDGDHLLRAGGDVDEATLLAFVSTVEPATSDQYDALLAQATSAHQRVPERDRAVFTDGVVVSMHSEADIHIPEESSFGPRSLCVSGDRTVCTVGARPITQLGLLSRLTSTQTVDGHRELVIWTRRGPAVTRLYDADTRAELTFQTATGSSGEFTRVRVPPGVVDIAMETQVAGEPFFRTDYLDVDVMDPYADVVAPDRSAG